MPVSYNADIQGATDRYGDTHFTNVDRKLLTHRRTAKKLQQYFAKSRFNWNIIVSDQIDYYDREKVTPVPNAITFVMINSPEANISHPMTPWMIAHRIGHAIYERAFDDGFEDLYNGTIDALLLSIAIPALTKQFPEQAGPYANKLVSNDFSWLDDLIYDVEGSNRALIRALASAMTMKSATTGKLDDLDEMRNELVAQYLVTGKVTLRGEPQARFDKLARLIEATFDKDFAKLVGKVISDI